MAERRSVSPAAKCLRKRRFEIIVALGGKCVCCGLDDPMFLTIDHVNGGGTEHRGRTNTYQYKKQVLDAVKSGSKDYQLLCFNCNCAKNAYGSYPHTWSDGVDWFAVVKEGQRG